MPEDGSDFHAAAASLSPGVAPSFGTVPDAEPFPERLILTSEAQSRIAQTPPLAQLNGDFTLERVGHGNLLLRETSSPGEVHVHADVLTLGGPHVHLDARVRRSWLSRTVDEQDSTAPNVRVVNGLIRLAAIPRQSTVIVSVDAD